MSARALARSRWQGVLSMLGIALGVAVVVAIDLANDSARRGFELSMTALTGAATHHLVGGPNGLDESLYVELRRDRGVRNVAPVVEGFVQLGGHTLRLMGVDPFAERGFRSHFTGLEDGEALRRLLIEPATIAMGRNEAGRLGLEPGAELTLSINGRAEVVTLAGLLSDDEMPLHGLVMADIATAQELLGRLGRLDRIDLVQDEVSEKLPILPPGVERVASESHGASAEQMTRAFRLNLTAMSLLALVVGGFLVYNAMTFSVLRRRALLGSLRLLGVTPREIFVMVMVEALLLGLAGTALGLLFGYWIGQGLLQLVTRTINDLYFVLTVTQLEVSGLSLAKGMLLGLGATAIAAAMPALEAARTAPQAVTRRSVVEQRMQHALPRLTALGMGLLLLGGLLLLVPGGSLVLGFASLFLLIVGFGFCVPLLVQALSGLAAWLSGGSFSGIGRLASRGISAGLSRTGLAVAALAVAVSATVGVGVMVNSFRHTVVVWLEQTLQSDIYVSPATTVASRSEQTLDVRVIQRLRQLPGIASISPGRRVEVSSPSGPVRLFALHAEGPQARGFPLKEGDPEQAWQALQSGNAVLISEPFAYHRRLATGDTLTLLTEFGLQSFLVAGVVYDYGSDQGLVLMSRSLYGRYWQDPAISSMGLYLRPGYELEATTEQVRQALADLPQQVLVRSNRDIRELSLAIFDRTFTITHVLRLVAVGVAFIGVLSALLALQLEQAREYAVLRALGVTPRELFAMVSGQTALLGLTAGLLALPLGLGMAQILISVINTRSFGWSMQTIVPPLVLAQAVVLAVVAALLAGLYPALRMARTSPAAALREE